jgi:hypothetical protein
MEKWQELLKIVEEELSNLYVGEEFIVKDLFKGYIWRRENIKTRRNLGLVFLELVNSSYLCRIRPLYKTKSNQQKYKILRKII